MTLSSFLLKKIGRPALSPMRLIEVGHVPIPAGTLEVNFFLMSIDHVIGLIEIEAHG
jgi:hypothetical protein